MVFVIFPFLFALSFTQNSYNFPMEVEKSNLIYLKEYLPIDLQAPNYQISGQNDFNLTIQQSLLLLDQQSFSIDFNIKCGSNYFLEFGTTTNAFWFLTMSNYLYQGQILENGGLEINQNILLQQQNCLNINLLQANYGILTCESCTNNSLTFLLVNFSSLETQIINTNQYINIYLGNISTSITQNNGIFNIIVTNVEPKNVIVYYYTMSKNILNFLNQTNLQGEYIQVLVSEQQNYLFLLGSQQLDIVSLNGNLRTSLVFKDSSLQNLALYQFSENMFRIALYQSDSIITFLYDVKIKQKILNLQSKVLIESSTIIYLSVQPTKIFIVTNLYITQLVVVDQPKSQLIIENYLNLLLINFALINENRQIAIIFVFNQETFLDTISSYYFNDPQIKISSDLSMQIYQQFPQNYSIQFSINSGLTHQQQQFQVLYIIPVDQTRSTCPITFKNSYDTITLEYPDKIFIPYSDVFIGPNITRSISAPHYYQDIDYSLSDYVTPYYSGVKGSIFSKVCANFHNIPIYCFQFKNYTLRISQWAIATQSYYIDTNNLLTDCQCYQNGTQLSVQFQFQNNIIIQQFDEVFQPTQQLKFQFNQTISSSDLFHNQLLIILKDGSLQAYKLENNNQTILFQIQGYGLQKIYTNQIAYPNFLFLDNKTNLIIMYYKSQHKFQIINQIPYPNISSNYVSTFGILRNGIFLSIVEMSSPQSSLLYFYPRQFIFYTQPLAAYFQYDLMGFQYFNGIFSSYSSQHYYLNLQDSNQKCCYFTILKGSGTPFTLFEFQTMLSPYLQFISSVEDVQNGNDLLLGFTSNGGIYNATKTTGFYEVMSLFQLNYSANATLYYSAANSGCDEILIHQNFTVVQDKNLIGSKILNQQQQNISFNTQSNFKIQPQQLFYGNIQSYDVTCDKCKSFSYNAPTSNSSFIIVNITYQAAVQFENILYIQDNQSLYYLDNDTQLAKVYDFPESYPTCNSLFFEMLSNFPVSICHNFTTTAMFAFNFTSNEIITNKSLQIQNFFKSNYNNGIFQIGTQYNQSKNKIISYFYQYYMWIADSQIIFYQIDQQLQILGSIYSEFVYLKISTNFSSDPCQVFGFTIISTDQNENPKFYLTKACVPSFISQIFGFPPNQYSEITVNYTNCVTWLLAQTFNEIYNFISDVIQIGENQYLGNDLVETQFLAPSYILPTIYKLTFNLTNGLLINFREQAKLFIEFDTYQGYFFTYWSNTGILACIQSLGIDDIIISIYPPLNESVYKSANTVQMIGALYQNASFTNSNNTVFGDYYLRFGNDPNTTMIFQLQNQLSIIADLGNEQSAQMLITVNNYFSTSQQSLILTNLDYVWPTPTPSPELEPEHEPNPQPQSDDNTSHLTLILSILGGIILITGIGIVIYKLIQRTNNQDYDRLENLVEMK